LPNYNSRKYLPSLRYITFKLASPTCSTSRLSRKGGFQVFLNPDFKTILSKLQTGDPEGTDGFN